MIGADVNKKPPPPDPASQDETSKIPILEKKEMPYWEGYADGHKDGRSGPLGPMWQSHAFHTVNHSETYNKNWADGETQMTLEELGKKISFITACMGSLFVAILAILLITLIK